MSLEERCALALCTLAEGKAAAADRRRSDVAARNRTSTVAFSRHLLCQKHGLHCAARLFRADTGACRDTAGEAASLGQQSREHHRGSRACAHAGKVFAGVGIWCQAKNSGHTLATDEAVSKGKHW